MRTWHAQLFSLRLRRMVIKLLISQHVIQYMYLTMPLTLKLVAKIKWSRSVLVEKQYAIK